MSDSEDASFPDLGVPTGSDVSSAFSSPFVDGPRSGKLVSAVDAPFPLFNGSSGGSSAGRIPKYTTIPPTIRRLSLDLPFYLHLTEGANGQADVDFTVNNNHRLALYSSFPVTRRVLGSVQASGGTRGRIGHSVGQVDVSYRLDPKNVGEGPIQPQLCALNAGLQLREKPQISAGITGKAGSHSTTVLRISVPPQVEQWQASFSQTQAFHLVTVRAHCSISSPSRQRPISTTSGGITMSSRGTIHTWSTGISWLRLDRLLEPNAWCSIGMRAFDRLVNVSAGWSFKDQHQWRLSIVTNKTSGTGSLAAIGTQIGVGLTRLSNKGWTWLLALSQGGYSLRIPVSIVSDLSVDPLWYPLQVLYAALWSHVLQEMLATIMLPTDEDANDPKIQLNRQAALTTKARTTAIQQQRLMERQAKSRRADEEKRKGLVIQKAVFFVERIDGSGDTLRSVNVTIPLQFWVTDSTLELPAKSKQNLLGFYDITTDLLLERQLSYYGESTPRSESTPCWKGFWTKHASPSTKMENPYKPKLRVEYEFHGLGHIVTTNDEEKLRLPRQA